MRDDKCDEGEGATEEGEGANSPWMEEFRKEEEEESTATRSSGLTE